jgi:hypothetical protein
MAGLPGCWMGVIVQYGCDGSIRNANSCFGVAFVLGSVQFLFGDVK